MFLAEFLAKRRPTRAGRNVRAKSHRGQPVSPAICESLDRRLLLTQYIFTVPIGSPPNTAAYLQPVPFQPRQVQVRLNNAVTGPIVHTFENTEGQDVIRVQTGVTGFKFVDQVPASLKPFPDGDDDAGILVQGGTGNTLMIDEKGPVDTLPGNVDDTLIQVLEFDSTTAVVVNTFGLSVLGAGVDHLTIRTNDVQATRFRLEPGTGPTGTDVVVPSLSAGIHLSVDTGAGTFDRIILGQNNTITEQVMVKTGAGNCIVDLQQADGDDGTNALVDFTGGQLGLGNKLLIHSVGSATLALAPGSQHTIYVDEVIVSGVGSDQRGTFIVEDPATIGHMQVGNPPFGFAIARIQADSTISTITVANDGKAFIEAESTIGTFEVDGIADFTANATVDNFDDSGGTVNVFSADVIVLNQSEINNLNVLGTNASVLFKNTGASPTVTRVTNLTVTSGGLVTVQARNESPATPDGKARKLIVNTLDLDKTMNPTGKLDLKDNILIVDYAVGAPSPLHDVRELITFAWNNGAWDNNGITSSLGDASTHALGYAENDGSSSGVGYTNFESQPVDDTTVLVKYTFYGDADLTGNVNLQDFNRLATNFGASDAVWAQGDFNYDRNVNLQDFNRLASNFGAGGLAPGDEMYTYEELEEMLEG